MRSSTLLGGLAVAGLGYAFPKNGCSTVTTEVIVPTTTATYESTAVVTEHPTTAENLGTFTYVTTISKTTTLETLTSTRTSCIATGIITKPVYKTVYTTAPTSKSKRVAALDARSAACTVTSTHTTYYGQTYTFVPANKTSTFTDYTTFSQATVTKTKSGGRAYTIATATAVTSATCGSVTRNVTTSTSTITRDVRCAPSALTSAYSSYGLEYQDDVPLGGAAYTTTTSDASACCQLCAQAHDCSASSWDIRTGQCKLEFAVDYDSGKLACGEGLMAYYDYGPDHPMAPGTGLWVAALCGDVEFAAAQPDDGT